MHKIPDSRPSCYYGLTEGRVRRGRFPSKYFSFCYHL